MSRIKVLLVPSVRGGTIIELKRDKLASEFKEQKECILPA